MVCFLNLGSKECGVGCKERAAGLTANFAAAYGQIVDDFQLVPHDEMLELPFPVNALSLHASLEVGRDFATWIKDRIEKFQLVESKDYGVFPEMGENPKGGRPAVEYRLTIRAASWLLGNWSQNSDTKRVLKSLERSIGIPMDLLAVSIVTGPNEGRGTWVHKKVALHLANWCSPEFYADVLDWTVDE